MLFENENFIRNDLFKRKEASYINNSHKFQYKTRDFSKQYAHIYAHRLTKMTELLRSCIERKWGSDIELKSLCDLREEKPEKCVLIGTLFKHQVLKPSILKEISEENQLAPQPPKSHFVDEEDKLILEDSLQRIRLLGNIDVHNVVTGIVCAVLGYEDGEGKFMVEDYIFYEGGPQKPLQTLEDSPLLVIMSGLDQSNCDDISMSLELFQQWVLGNLDGFGQSRDYEAASIVRVIIAGNSVKSSHKNQNRRFVMDRTVATDDVLDAVKSVDTIMHNLSKSVYVDLMSGEYDPANHMLPQQPMHHCMFPKSAQSKNIAGVTNPYECEIAGRVILGTSGQNTADILKFSNIEDPLEALRLSIIWSHISPTSPDTLPCYPYYEYDPFIIEECPHVYFTANTTDFKTDIHEGRGGKRTRLVCVPAFSDTQTIAVVNLKTLECQQLCFKINEFNDEE